MACSTDSFQSTVPFRRSTSSRESSCLAEVFPTYPSSKTSHGVSGLCFQLSSRHKRYLRLERMAPATEKRLVQSPSTSPKTRSSSALRRKATSQRKVRDRFYSNFSLQKRS